MSMDFAVGNFFDDTPFWKITWLHWFMYQSTRLGYEGVVITAVIVTGVITLRRSWAMLVLWVTTVGGAIIINRLIKGHFETVRPMVGHPDVLEVSTGFPSGHTMLALVAYGLLTYIISQDARNRRLTRYLVIATVLLVGHISLTRLYLTAHYPSDVLGGIAGGLAWMAFCIGVFRWISDRDGIRRGSE